VNPHPGIAHSAERPWPGCYGCDLKAKGLTLVCANQRNDVPPRRDESNSWEKGRAGEHRADGSFMPYLNEVGSALPIKDYAENRRVLDGRRREQLNRTTPIGSHEPA
jgi:hypothetical protein